MEKEDIFNFDDFFKRQTKSKDEIINPYKEDKEESKNEELLKESQFIEDDIIEEEIEEEDQIEYTERVSQDDDDNDYYKLYSDKNEEFSCDISIEGADQSQSEARLIIESNDWNLVFNGEIVNGKCTIPIRKLNILKEGEVGTIKLEVIAEGNIFTPWEDKFKVKLSKKVTVKVNEQRETVKKKQFENNKVGVKVNIKR